MRSSLTGATGLYVWSPTVMKPLGGNGRLSLARGTAANPGAEAAPRVGLPMLVGRRQELALLLEATVNPPALVIVEGEAGIGKTRLVQAMLGDRAVNGRRVLVGRGQWIGEPFPLGPMLEALREIGAAAPATRPSPVAGALAPLLPELAIHLPPEPRPLDEPRATQHRIFRAILELLAALGPGILVLEDLQWADPATLALLSCLVRRPPPGLSILLTYRRQGTVAARGVSELISGVDRTMLTRLVSLGPLDSEEVRRMIATILGTDEVPDELARRIYASTSGVPFAVEEVLRTLRDRDPVLASTGRPGGELGEIPVPPAIREASAAIVAGLGPDARLIVQAAAVLGGPADEDLVVGVAGLPPSRGARGLLEALATGALQECDSGLYGFRYELAARAVSQAIPGPVRRRLHLRAARGMEGGSGPRLVRIAHHLREGGEARWTLYAEAAANRASSSGDDRLAARLLEDALAVPNLSRAARVRMAIGLCDATMFGCASQNAIGILRKVVDETQTEELRGELRFSVSILLGQAGDPAWRAEAVRAVGELRSRPELQVHAMMNLAQPAFHISGEPEDHLAWLGRAMEAAERCGDPLTRLAVQAQRAVILLSLGDRAGWSAIRDIPGTGAGADERLHLLRAHHALAMTALGLGHHQRAEVFLATADRLQAELRNPWWDLWLGTSHACFDLVGGRWGGLEARIRELLRETATMPALSVDNRQMLGSLLLARGRLEDARATLSAALEAACDTQRMSARVGVAGRLARVQLELEDPATAAETAQLGIDALRRIGTWVAGRIVVPEATEALIACGNLGGADALVTEFAAGLRGRDAPAAQAALAVCRGAVAQAAGRRVDAERHFARAETRWAKLPHRLEAARARERRAGSRLDGADQGCGELLLGALETFEELGADGDARRVRARLRAIGAWRGGRRGYGGELSPREAEVSRLAAAGRTNREIARALFISPRTVEAHVAASLRKLRLTSRDEIASVAGLGQR